MFIAIQNVHKVKREFFFCVNSFFSVF